MIPILFKVHGSGANAVLAACDKELCGKTLKSEKLEFLVSEGFYKGNEITEDNLRNKLHEFDNVNLVGNRVVSIAIEENLVLEENVIEISKVKHVQIFKI